MLERRQFVAAGLAGMAAATLPNPLKADEHEHHASHDHDRSVFEKCAAACSECQRECNSCANHCAMMLKQGHSKHATTLATCQDCADMCVAAAQIVSRRGPFAELICKACADACAKCAEACKKFPDDKHMAECAKVCLECEKACREMLSA